MSKPLPSSARLLLALLWLGTLLLVGWLVSQRLQMSSDLRSFLPAPQTPAQTLLIEELGEGPGSRLLLMAIKGDSAETLASISQTMRAQLATDAQFELIANGEQAGLEQIPAQLLPYRYVLADNPDGFLNADTLRQALDERLADLGSPAAGLVEPLIPSDPTLEILRLAEQREPAHAPQRLHDVWFDRAGEQALLLVQTRAGGFDPGLQQLALNAIETAFNSAKGDSSATLDVTGPGAFSVQIHAQTQREVSTIGMLDGLMLVTLLLLAYRSWKMPLLGALPLVSAGLAGLSAVALLYEDIHGITIAFGFTLIGVAQDYPVHLFSHQRRGLSPWQNVRSIWPTLATGVISTCIAYVTFLLSGVGGLEQLAVFTITALLTAALTTRYALPALLDPDSYDPANSQRLRRLWQKVATLPHPRASLLVLGVLAGLVIAFAPGAVWQNDLSKLTPVPEDAMAVDTRLRDELGAPDVRYLLTVSAADTDAALAASEALIPMLDAQVAAGHLDGYDLAARYLPSSATQRARQAALPDAQQLQVDLDTALVGSAFLPEVFAPFLADVEHARTAKPLTLADLRGTPLEAATAGLLLEHAQRSTALVSLSGVHDATALANAAQAHGAALMDLKEASESLVAQWRSRVLWTLALAAVLLALAVWVSLRTPSRVWRVLVPVFLSTLLLVAIQRALGVEFTVFHLVALILAAGLGLDYALFFEHAGEDGDDQVRTFHAIIVCSITTFFVFAVLGASSIPVLRAIGSTVAMGVALNFILGLLIARHQRRPNAETAAEIAHP